MGSLCAPSSSGKGCPVKSVPVIDLTPVQASSKFDGKSGEASTSDAPDQGPAITSLKGTGLSPIGPGQVAEGFGISGREYRQLLLGESLGGAMSFSQASISLHCGFERIAKAQDIPCRSPFAISAMELEILNLRPPS